MTEIEDRRQRAREAAYDEIGLENVLRADASRAAEAAIETATRVRVDDEIIEAYASVPEIREGLIAAFRAAGFEVEQ